MIGESNDETNFSYKLLIFERQVAKLRKAFANNSSADVKLPKIQLSKMVQSGGFLGRFLGPVLGLPFMRNILKAIS